ncbi:MBL fold metallo-hydrolase [Clostridium hydrogenum]|uniref:MBL fold metallo-hydrolase n=1 Tax=Clostridium hydrogenum TaxID=2855764 RepID=UPI001F2F1339|nr:MBL fold metallo-hydrolase [Clostridium hydrogenum]
MKINNFIEMLEISFNIMGNQAIINPTLIRDDSNMILVDAGCPGQLPQIKEAMAMAGISFNKLDKVILTHHDIDHIGSVSSILKELPNVKVFAHEKEIGYINGEKRPIKLAQMEDNLDSLSPEMKAVYEKFKIGFENSKVNVDKTLIDDEILPYCGGIKVIFTPGHTLGHICLYLEQYKILIAGDALSVENGMLCQMSSAINCDMNLYTDSLKKLTEYDVETVICYHGGVYDNNVNKAIEELYNKLSNNKL